MKKARGRPKKKAADVKSVDLRIPVTSQQKAAIYGALRGKEFAAWARDVLLAAATASDSEDGASHVAG